MTDEVRARDAICRLGASLFARGLTFGSSGNISVKLDDGWLMTPTNVAMGDLDPARLSRLDATGRHIGGDAPTKEGFLHRVMYEGRADASAVVHLHATHSVAVSCLADIDPDRREEVGADLIVCPMLRSGDVPDHHRILVDRDAPPVG